MSASQYQENIFFHYILNNLQICEATEPQYFTNKIISQVFEIAQEHALKYKEAPTLAQINEIISIKGLSDTLNKDITETLYKAKDALNEYDETWLEDNAAAWVKMRNLDVTIRRAVAYIKTSPANSENAASIVESVKQMIVTGTAIDFNFNLGLDFFDAASHKQSKLKRSTTGYNYTDLCLKGGYWPGALIVLLAGPKAGKCSSYDTKIKIRNKKTGEIKLVNIGDFHKSIKSEYTKDDMDKYMIGVKVKNKI